MGRPIKKRKSRDQSKVQSVFSVRNVSRGRKPVRVAEREPQLVKSGSKKIWVRETAFPDRRRLKLPIAKSVRRGTKHTAAAGDLYSDRGVGARKKKKG